MTSRRICLRAVPAVVALVLCGGNPFVEGAAWHDPAELLPRLLAARDAGTVDPELMRSAASARNPQVRLTAVRLVASVAHPSDVDRLWPFVSDPEPAVRSAAQVAAGRLGPAASALVRRGLADPSPAVRAAAVWAAAPMEDESLLEVLRRLLEREETPAVLARLAMVVGHVPDPTARGIVHRLSGSSSVEVRRALAFWVGRTGARHRVLRSLAADADPAVRAAALTGLARGDAEPADQRLVVRALGDEASFVRIAACRVLAARGGWRLGQLGSQALSRCLLAENRQLRAEAARAAGVHREAELGGALDRFAAGGDPWLGALALEAMARRDPDQSAGRVGLWLHGGETWRRSAAAVAAASVNDRPAEWIELMLTDPEPAVRLAWLGAAPQSAVSSDHLDRVIASDPDAAVRALAVERRGAAAGVGVETWLAWYAEFADDELPDARSAALIGALEAAATDDRRREILEIGTNDPSAVVSAAAARWAWRHDLQAAAPRRSVSDPCFYRELVRWMKVPRWLDVVTVRGTFRTRLDAERAPITARRIWDLAQAGFYDGLTFHRVVPNFVVQGGDPRGDGWGGGGLVLPDEPSLASFDRGRVGIATSGPNTGGCQLFAMVQPAPHLDGRYTAFGRVTDGVEVLDRLGEGDGIRRVVGRAGGEPPPLTPTLLGRVVAEDLWDLPGWLDERDGADPDPEALARLRSLDERFTVTVVLGTWCSDSRREVPRLIAVLERLDPGSCDLNMVGVDRTMLVPEGAVAETIFPGRLVDAVPTVVVTDRWGGELGRVIEVAERPWEHLLAEMLEGDDGE